MDRVWNGYRLCILGDLNRWIGDETRASITGAFEVPGDSDNGRRLVEVCAERGLCLGITLSTGVYITTQRWQGVKMLWEERA